MPDTVTPSDIRSTTADEHGANLVQRAANIIQEADARHREEERKRASEDILQHRRALSEKLGKLLHPVPAPSPERIPENARLVVDGLTFTVTRDRDRHYEFDLMLEVPCQSCGEPCLVEIYSLEGLGRTLAKPEDQVHRWPHRCPPEQAKQETPPPPTPPTVAEQLESLVRVIVADELANRES